MTGRLFQTPPTADADANPAVGGTNPLAPLVVAPAEPLPQVKAGQKCGCWGASVFRRGGGRLRLDPAAAPRQGGILGLGHPPCTPQTCNPACKACQTAGRPFLSHEDLRFLEHGTGPMAAELARLWAARDKSKIAPGRRPPTGWCKRGHDREPDRPNRDCKACATERRRATRATARQAAGA